MKTILFLILLPATFSICSWGQIALPDPEPKTQPGKEFNKTEAALKLAQKYLDKNVDSTFFYVKKAIAFAKESKQDSLLLDGYFIAGKAAYYIADYATALSYAEQVKTLAIALKKPNSLITYHQLCGNVKIDQNNFDEAINHYKEIINIAERTKDVNNLMLGYNNLAYAYRKKGDYNSAVTLLYKKIKIAEKEKSNFQIAATYQQLAVIYLRKKDFENAKTAMDEALRLFNLIEDYRNVMITQNLLSIYYDESLRNVAMAIATQKKNLELAEKLKDNRTIAMINAELGRYYYQKKDYENAKKHYTQAINLYKIFNLKNDMEQSYIGLANVGMYTGHLDVANNYLDTALQIIKINKSVISKKALYESLLEYNILAKNPEEALLYKKYYIETRDSLLNQDNNKIINELKIAYETEKKAHQINLLNSENQLQKSLLAKKILELYNNQLALEKNALLLKNKDLELGNQNLKIDNQNLELQNNRSRMAKQESDINAKAQTIKLLSLKDKLKGLELQRKNIYLAAILALSLLAGLLGISFYKRKKLQQEALLQKEINAQQDLTAKEVINAEEQERQRMSATLHDGLGQLLSVVKMNLQALEPALEGHPRNAKIYNNALSLLDDSIHEMRQVSHQIVSHNVLSAGLENALKKLIEKIDSNKLNITLQTQNLSLDLDEDIQLVLYRIFQESINNVIKHAKASKLEINIAQNQNTLSADITDDGIGFEETGSAATAGIGLNNIRTRVRFLKGTMQIKSAPNKGTLLRFEIPVKQSSLS